MRQPDEPKARERATPVVRVVGLDPPKVTLEELILLERFAGDLIGELAASNDNEGDAP